MRARIPTLSNEAITIRLAANDEEIDCANRLVFRNYVADGFWDDDEGILHTNRYLQSKARTVVIVLENQRIVGTMSVIKDSPLGLPSDGTQGRLMQQLRKSRKVIAEVSAFAMDRSVSAHRKLVLFLMSYVLQYCSYYAGIQMLVGSCKSEHADFYESTLCFSKVSDLTYYDYSRANGYLISLDLAEAHMLLREKYPPDPVTNQSLYSFLLRTPHACHRFPAGEGLRREMPKVA